MLKNIVVLGRSQMKVWLYILQQPLREGASILRYTYVTCFELSNRNITFL